MTAITMRFHGFYEDVLEAMIRAGFAQTKAEAIRLALFNLAMDRNLLDDKMLLKELRKQARAHPRSPEEVAEGIEDAKRTAVRG